jgi:hypothetical protein
MPDPEKTMPMGVVTDSHDHHTSDSSIQRTAPEKEMEISPATDKEDDSISLAPSQTSTISEHDHVSKQDGQPQRPTTISRTATIVPDAVIVDRRDRRGLFSGLTLIPEVKDPYHYTRRTKWLLTIIVAFCGMAAPMGSAIVMPCLQDIAKEFHATHTVANMSVAVYMLAMSIFPLYVHSPNEAVYAAMLIFLDGGPPSPRLQDAEQFTSPPSPFSPSSLCSPPSPPTSPC